jgi:uncharacterized protein (DUF433 family)
MLEEKIAQSLLELPLYTYSEADYLVGASRGTASRWLSGYQFRDSRGRPVRRPPVTLQAERDAKGVSFIDLVELVAIRALKDFGFTLLEIREVVTNCQELTDVPRPLASLEFKAGGRELFITQENTLVEVLRGRGRRAWQEVLEPFLATLDYQDHMARRWWPLGRDVPVLLDPEYGFGFPVVQGTGVRTEILLERFQIGELPEQIAKDFNLTHLEVERALQFELSRLKPAA